jgi:hypothetical protein
MNRRELLTSISGVLALPENSRMFKLEPKESGTRYLFLVREELCNQLYDILRELGVKGGILPLKDNDIDTVCRMYKLE